MEIDQSQQNKAQDDEFRVIAKWQRGQSTALSQMNTIGIANIATFFSSPTVEFRGTPELQALFPGISTPGSSQISSLRETLTNNEIINASFL